MNDRLFLGRHLAEHASDYDGFILGSSRSKAFKTYDWKNYNLQTKSPFHLGVNDETLFGLYSKLDFLSSQGIENPEILILLDHRLLSLDRDHSAHIFREYWKFTDETLTQYYQRFVVAFLNPEFISRYLSYQLGNYQPSEHDEYFWDPGFCYVKESGDIDYCRMDSLIASDSAGYYNEYRSGTFYDRSYAESYQPKPVISESGLEILSNIKDLVLEMNANCKVVLTPNYDQVPLHQNDVQSLEEIFEMEILNLSGSNEITSEVGNFYEERHFKPYVARQIMNELY